MWTRNDENVRALACFSQQEGSKTRGKKAPSVMGKKGGGNRGRWRVKN